MSFAIFNSLVTKLGLSKSYDLCSRWFPVPDPNAPIRNITLQREFRKMVDLYKLKRRGRRGKKALKKSLFANGKIF